MLSTNSESNPLRLSIAVPSSFIDIYPNKAQKTQHIGRIARAASIFQVDEILVYLDEETQRQRRNNQLITQVLEYMETPQYLRKHLFKKLPELQYVGLLPPLRTPHHPVEKRIQKLKQGEIREGYAFQQGGQPVVDIGVEVPLPLQNIRSERLPARITVQVHRSRSGDLVAQPYSFTQSHVYWGYKVQQVPSLLGDFLQKTSAYKFIVATTRKGNLVNNYAPLLRQTWQKVGHLLLLFGSHKEGLDAILSREGLDLIAITSYQVNFLSAQGVATVRVEEAVLIGLTIFRLLEQAHL
ncbi:MAG: putative RNA uridine N3 methyltransferase [Candidatus Hodarchaeota archaeon]